MKKIKSNMTKTVSTTLALTALLGLTIGAAVNTNNQSKLLETNIPASASMQSEASMQKSEIADYIKSIAGSYQGTDAYDNAISKFDDSDIKFNEWMNDGTASSHGNFKILSDHHGNTYNSVAEDIGINEYTNYVVYQNIDGSKEIRSWGYNNYGLLGSGEEDQTKKLGWAEAAKVKIDLDGKTFKFLETHNDTTFVVLNNGECDEVWAWGNNDHGQLFIDESIEIVTKPTRILEDKIPNWGSIVGIDASLGSTVIYFQGTEGQEYDPRNYNEEDLWVFGAGDNSKGQDAKTTMFDNPLFFKDKHYIASDANDQSYSLLFENSDDTEEDDTRVVNWGDNSNYILGTGDNLQPEDGYVLAPIHDEGLERGEVTKFEDVSAGTNNFYYLTDNNYDTWETRYETSAKKFATGSKVSSGLEGNFVGIEYMPDQYNGNVLTEGPYDEDGGLPKSMQLHQISAGDDYLAQISTKTMMEYYPNYASKWINIDSIGLNDHGQLGSYGSDSIFDSSKNSYYTSSMDTTHWMSDPETNPDVIHFNEGYVVDNTLLETNNHTTFAAVSTSWKGKSDYRLLATGSDSTGLFDKYSTDNEGDQSEFAFTSSYDINEENIKFSVLEDETASTSVRFTIDTSNDSGLINPNSYQLKLAYKSGDEWHKINDRYATNLVSFDGEGKATWEISGLEPNTEYEIGFYLNNLSYTTVPLEIYTPAFTVTTSGEFTAPPAPTIDSARIEWNDNADASKEGTIFNYWVKVDEPVAGQSETWLQTVELIYNDEVIGAQDWTRMSSADSRGYKLDPSRAPNGKIEIPNDIQLPWDSTIDVQLRVTYGDYDRNEYTEIIDLPEVSTPGYATWIPHTFALGKAAKVDSFKQISSTEAEIYYSINLPPVDETFAPDVVIDEVRITQGPRYDHDEVTLATADTTNAEGKILLTNLTPDTLYSDLWIAFDYSMYKPESDLLNPGELITTGTYDNFILPFRTLKEGQASIASNLEYVSYDQGRLETKVDVIADEASVINTDDVRVSVVEDDGITSKRVEKEVEVTELVETETKSSSTPLATKSYNLVINDIKEGAKYSSWKITTTDIASSSPSDWTAIEIEESESGVIMTNFISPEHTTNNTAYIALDSILLILIVALLILVIVNSTKKPKKEETKVIVKGGKDE